MAEQINFQNFTYVDDNAAVWNKRGEDNPAVNAISGQAALTPGARVFPRDTRRYHTRFALFYDPTTFRTKRIIVYTPAAFAAITGASTLAVNVPGNSTTVTYNLSQKIGEKQPVAKTSSQKIDHT